MCGIFKRKSKRKNGEKQSLLSSQKQPSPKDGEKQSLLSSQKQPSPKDGEKQSLLSSQKQPSPKENQSSRLALLQQRFLSSEVKPSPKDSGKMTGNGDLTWMDDVRSKLTKVYESNAEDLVRVLHYLDEEDKKFYSNTFRPYAPNWNSLKSLLNDKNTFKKYADELIRKSREDEYEKSLSSKALAVQNQLRNENMTDNSFKISDFFNLQKVWSKLAYLIKAAVIDGIKKFATNEVAAKIGTVSLRNTVTVGVAALTGVQLGYEVYQHIKRWWNGEIDGKWCAKHVVDDTAPIVGGAAGAAAGAFYGSLAGPWGAILGGLVGGFVGGAAANALIDKVTQYIFGLPKSEALSNAYRYLRVPETASNSEVNNAYHKLCLRHHPDKGGDKEEFFILQCHMSVIRQSRGEY